MTDQALPAAQSIQTVVQSFTQAELALTEVMAAVAQFRSASEQLASAEVRSEQATQALLAAAAASDQIAAQLESAVTVLKAVDPERLWQHLEARQAEHAAHVESTAANANTMRRLGIIALASSVLSLVLLGLLATGVLPT